MQGFEIRIAGVEGVGVCAVGIQHQGAVGAGEGAGGDRAATLPNRYPIGALHVVAQHIAVERQQGFRGGAIDVAHGAGQVVNDVHVQ
ncbi:hypothetical protein D3C85_1720280 [compost metagenome]